MVENLKKQFSIEVLVEALAHEELVIHGTEAGLRLSEAFGNMLPSRRF